MLPIILCTRDSQAVWWKRRQNDGDEAKIRSTGRPRKDACGRHHADRQESNAGTCVPGSPGFHCAGFNGGGHGVVVEYSIVR